MSHNREQLGQAGKLRKMGRKLWLQWEGRGVQAYFQVSLRPQPYLEADGTLSVTAKAMERPLVSMPPFSSLVYNLKTQIAQVGKGKS